MADESNMTPEREPQGIPTFRDRVQHATGALTMEDIKKWGLLLGVAVLFIIFSWRACRSDAPTAKRVQTSPQSTATSDQTVDAALDAQLREAERARRAAEEARKRAERGDYPHPPPIGNATVAGDSLAVQRRQQEQQLAMQLQQERMRREAAAPYASSVSFSASSSAKSKDSETESDKEKPATSEAANNTTSQAASVTAANPASLASANASVPTYVPYDRVPGGPYRLPAGSWIETTLLNRLDGDFTGPVVCQVSQEVYDKDMLTVLIPRGSRVLGESRAVQGSFDQRLSVTFHRLIMPNLDEVNFDKFRGLDQIGSTGLADKVNHHYLQLFGVSIAIGAIGGLSQIGVGGGYGYDPSISFRIGVTQQMGQSAMRIFEHYLNRRPTITIREGQRVKIYLTQDIDLPPYDQHAMRMP